MSLSANIASFGTLSASAVRYAASSTAGLSSDSADAIALTASSSASGGYVITVDGTTLTSNGKTIAPIGASATASSIGIEQFGMRLVLNSGTGSVVSPYNTANWAFDTAAFPDIVATGSSDGVDSVFGIRYIANISSLTSAGSYTTNLTYIMTATY